MDRNLEKLTVAYHLDCRMPKGTKKGPVDSYGKLFEPQEIKSGARTIYPDGSESKKSIHKATVNQTIAEMEIQKHDKCFL